MFGKLLIVSLVALVSKIAPVYAQYALPTFQAVHKRSATVHPGYAVTVSYTHLTLPTKA